MRISYALLTQVAQSGDVQAMNIMTQWEKEGDPTSPTMRTEAYFNDEVGFFLHTPPSILPKRRPTLVGLAPFNPPDVIIVDDDGDTDGDD